MLYLPNLDSDRSTEFQTMLIPRHIPGQTCNVSTVNLMALRTEDKSVIVLLEFIVSLPSTTTIHDDDRQDKKKRLERHHLFLHLFVLDSTFPLSISFVSLVLFPIGQS